MLQEAESPTYSQAAKKKAQFKGAGPLFINTSFEGDDGGDPDAALDNGVKATIENIESTLEQLQQDKECAIEELLERISNEKIERLADVRGRLDGQIKEKELEVRRTNVAKQGPLKEELEKLKAQKKKEESDIANELEAKKRAEKERIQSDYEAKKEKELKAQYNAEKAAWRGIASRSASRTGSRTGSRAGSAVGTPKNKRIQPDFGLLVPQAKIDLSAAPGQRPKIMSSRSSKGFGKELTEAL